MESLTRDRSPALGAINHVLRTAPRMITLGVALDRSTHASGKSQRDRSAFVNYPIDHSAGERIDRSVSSSNTRWTAPRIRGASRTTGTTVTIPRMHGANLANGGEVGAVITTASPSSVTTAARARGANPPARWCPAGSGDHSAYAWGGRLRRC